MHGRLLIALAILPIFLFPGTTHGQWQPDGFGVANTLNDQSRPAIATDGAGGAFIAWMDNRFGNYNIYVQRVDAHGVALWVKDGVSICNAINDQFSPVITSDGAGGAVVAWYDFRAGVNNADIYVQRINEVGSTQWTFNGVALCTATESQYDPRIVASGVGGAVVAWSDNRGVDTDIYAQRVSSAGAVLWTANGVAVCTAVDFQSSVAMVTDDAGGAILTWTDPRGATADIYAQRVNSSGVPQFVANGVAICTAANAQASPSLAVDGTGGAVIAWQDFRSGAGSDVFAQRLSDAGSLMWPFNGIPVSTATDNQYGPRVVSDGGGGAIIVWYDSEVHAQRFHPLGSARWEVNGVAVTTAAPGSQILGDVVSDGAGGAAIVYIEIAGLAMQRINGEGASLWAAAGVPLSAASGNQSDPVITMDSGGGFITAWGNDRGGAWDIYAQRVERTYGYWGHPEPLVSSVADVPNDQGGKVAVNWRASSRDVPTQTTIDFYSVWRAVDMAALAPSADAAGLSLDQIALDTAPGARVALAASPYYWELVGTQTAYRFPYYSFAASTRADSLAGDPGDAFFMVAAHDQTDEHIAFASNAVSGHSVDNLAPAAPLLLTAQRIGGDVHLKWNGVSVEDLRDYAAYRATTAGVTPIPMNFLSSSDDTLLVDTGAPLSALYYIVTALDVHGNQSNASNEASVSAPTGAGATPPLTALTVLPNHPNPFANVTQLQVGLPHASDVQVEIYDVAGRRVQGLEIKQAAAGWRTISISARDASGRALASGIYFCRVTGSGSTATRKMVVMR